LTILKNFNLEIHKEVLVIAGGFDGAEILDSVEVYSPGKISN